MLVIILPSNSRVIADLADCVITREIVRRNTIGVLNDLKGLAYII